VMATGIVSAALQAVGDARVSASLLAIAAACFTVIVAASALRAAAFPGDLRADLASPRKRVHRLRVRGLRRARDRLAGDGHDAAAAALAAAALPAWLALTCLVPGRMAVRHRTPPALTAAAVGFWILASSLIPLLLGRVAWRHLLRREPVRYRADLWMIVFPCGMYATASMQLGAAARLPLVHAVGTTAAWAAAFVWALTFVAMIVWLVTRRLLV
jgi:tellurite resistance protein TehA-like permease